MPAVARGGRTSPPGATRLGADPRLVSWLGLVLVAGGIAFALLLWRGIDYYLVPVAARSAEQVHRALRPSGSTGHLYGWIGTGIILSNLLYLARRRLARFRSLGPMSFWLRWHVASGILGPLLVVLHSALTMRTGVATLSSVSLGVLVITGLVGRYLHALVPRAPDGGARPADEVRADLDRALMRLRAAGGAGRVVADAMDTAATRILGPMLEGSRSSGGAVLVALRARLALRGLPGTARRIAREAGASREEVVAVSRSARAIALLELRADAPWLLDAAAVSWRGLHRIFAFLMVWSAALHVTVAFYLGYGF